MKLVLALLSDLKRSAFGFQAFYAFYSNYQWYGRETHRL